MLRRKTQRGRTTAQSQGRDEEALGGDAEQDTPCEEQEDALDYEFFLGRFVNFERTSTR